MTYDAHEIAEVFGRAAPTYDTVIPFFRTLGARLAEIADPRQGEAVLDVGCGRGATLFPVAERVGPGGRVLAVDLAEGMVEAVRADVSARGLSHVEVACMDAEHLDVDPGTFDLVVCSMLLHLVPDPPAAAASIAHAVRPGGRCAASVPAEGGPAWAFLGEVFDRYAAGRPMIVPFRPDFDLAGTLAGAGLDVTSTVVEEFTFHFPDEDVWWDWAWSHGMRGLFEVLPPDDLEGLKRDMFAELEARRTSDGIPMHQLATFVVAGNPAG